MFGWFKEKVADEGCAYPPPFNDQQKAGMEMPVPPVELNDWKSRHSLWEEISSCHCGQDKIRYVHLGGIVTYDICPKCGHRDKWETFVGRREWLYSRSRITVEGHSRSYTNEWDLPWCKDVKVVRWTPYHCEIKDKE